MHDFFNYVMVGVRMGESQMCYDALFRDEGSAPKLLKIVVRH